MRYKEAYALVIPARKLTKEEHDSIQELMNMLHNLVEGFTAFHAFIDEDYSDDMEPEGYDPADEGDYAAHEYEP